MYIMTTPVQHIRGVGPQKAAELNSLGIKTVLDLLEYRPQSYIFPGTTPIRDLRVGEQALIQGKVTACYRKPTQAPIVSVTVEDETGKVELMFFNQVWLLNNIRKGMLIAVWGKVSEYKGQPQFSGPKFSTCAFKPDEIAGGLYGKYTQTIRAALRAVLVDVEIPEWQDMTDETGEEALTRKQAFTCLHQPEEKHWVDVALDRLRFDELLIQQLAMAVKRRQQVNYNDNGIGLVSGYSKISDYFPYEFTSDQNQAIVDVLEDLRGGRTMNRLLHGDVGSGKTAVAFYAAMLTALNNKRAVILCPTTILAQQHYDTLRGMGWEDVELFIGGYENKAECHRKRKICIGTTALLLDTEMLKESALVIVDEQQKFGVQQRALLQKYGNPHVLLMSATPIPRTIALTVFGDLDVSTIKEMPIKRGAVVTRWVLPGKREGVYELIGEQLKAGHQAYIVYPRIKSGDEDIESAERGFMLIKHLFQGYEVMLLTGKNTSEVKSAALRHFKSGKIKILVSTVIAEVGLDCPNATVMLIEGADRFGLSQLHQLRGRVCRSTETAFCFLMASTANDTSIARLRTIEQTNDGFEIAEADLRLRGPGELFSTKQHGLPDLKFASLVDDYDLLLEARGLAKNSLDKLNTPEYNGLKQMLEIKYPKLDLIGVS